jgi:hypothetical protein
MSNLKQRLGQRMCARRMLQKTYEFSLSPLGKSNRKISHSFNHSSRIGHFGFGKTGFGQTPTLPIHFGRT